jgi:hypothetical protein
MAGQLRVRPPAEYSVPAVSKLPDGELWWINTMGRGITGHRAAPH